MPTEHPDGRPVDTLATRHTPRVRFLWRRLSIAAAALAAAFSWSGYDPRLQTHTAGLRSFDVQYRVDGGSWRLLRNDTTGTSWTVADRPRGRYGFRVQAADRRGTLGAWTSETTVWVP